MDIVLIIVAVFFIGLAALLLGAIVRFSIVSSWRTKGASRRLRKPDLTGIETACGFAPSADLVQMYRDSELVERVEFTLVDHHQTPNKRWFIGGFYPLTARDALEQRKVHGLRHGIPLADDLGKGVYFVASDGRIMFRPPGAKTKVVEVAPTVRAFSQFTPVSAGDSSDPYSETQ